MIPKWRVTDCDVTGEEGDLDGQGEAGAEAEAEGRGRRTYLIFHRTSHSHLLDRSPGLDLWQQVGVS